MVSQPELGPQAPTSAIEEEHQEEENELAVANELIGSQWFTTSKECKISVYSFKDGEFGAEDRAFAADSQFRITETEDPEFIYLFVADHLAPYLISPLQEIPVKEKKRSFIGLLRLWQKKTGLSSEELAKKTGILLSHLKKLEEGKRTPRREAIVRLVKVFGEELGPRYELGSASKVSELEERPDGFGIFDAKKLLQSAGYDLIGGTLTGDKYTVDWRDFE